ncbi:MAG: TonB-dependent receptor [Sandaracinaceae bacterium]|nr:TonB-dependent receptor [Sandaracinaceae bacterium]
MRPCCFHIFVVVLFPAFTLAQEGERGAEEVALDLAAEADVLFELGIEAQKSGNYRLALQYYLASQRLAPNKNVVFNIAVCFERLGRWSEAFRYYDAYSREQLDPSDRALVEEALRRLRPRVAVVRVTSTPSGALVYLDRRDLGARGRTPINLAVEPGEPHRVIFEMDGYETATSEEFRLDLGQELKVHRDLVRILGKVEVVGSPEGAEVRLDGPDGVLLGRMPGEFELIPGQQVIYVRAKGYQPLRREIQVIPRERIKVRLDLAQETGTLVVEADERGALIEVDGQARGFTPAVLSEIPAGRHTVRILRRGFRTHVEEVDVPPNGQVEVSARLRIEQEVAAASREVQSIEEVPTSVSLISAEEIRAFGYQTIHDAVLGLRGIYASNDLMYPSLGLRGFAQPKDYGNRLLVTLDGHSMNDDLLGSSYVGYDARTDLLDVERIELVRGPGSVLYGTNAFFGVINLVTRERDTFLPPHVSVATDMDRTFRLRTGGGFRLNNEVGAWVSAGGILSQGQDWFFPELDTPTVRRADDFIAGTAAFRLWAGNFTVQGQYHHRDARIPTGAFGTIVGDPQTRAADPRGFLEVRLTEQPDPGIGIFLRAFLDTYRYEGNFAYQSEDEMGNVVRFVTRDRWVGLWGGGEGRLSVRPVDWLRFAVGAETRGSIIAELRSGNDFEGREHQRFLNEEPRFYVVAAYAVTDIRPIREAWLNAGVRYDYMSTFADGALSPRGTLLIRPWEGGTFRLIGGGAFRAPSPYELRYYDGGQSQVQAVTLKAERVWTTELEYVHRVDDVSLIATVFHNRIENFVEAVDASMHPQCMSGDCFVYANADVPVLTVGGEAEVRKDFRQGWMLALTYSYQRTRFNDLAKDAKENLITNSPEHMASLRVIAPLIRDEMSLATRLRVESHRYAKSKEDPSRLVESEIPLLLDVVVSGSIPQIKLEYALGVRNLLDWYYRYPAGPDVPMALVPQLGRTFFLQSTLRFE